MKPGTLVIETVEGREGVWLCADSHGAITPLARFDDADAGVRIFSELFALARAASHAQGQLGI